MYFYFRNTAIHYQTSGSGKAVVLLHGFLESSEIWKEYSGRLSEDFRVITIDLPGHGESAFFSSGTTIDLMAETVNALLDELKVEKAHLVGHSMGGYVTLAFAELFRKKLSGFVLFHSTAFDDSEEALERRNKAIAMLKSHPELYINQTIPGLFRRETLYKFSGEKYTLIKNALKTGPPYQGYIEAVKAMRDRPDRIPVLRKNIPKLFLAGRYDPVIPENISFRQMYFMRHGESAFLEESGHMGFIEEKEAAYKIIRDFLYSVG